MNKVRQKRRVLALLVVAILLYLFTITKQTTKPKRELVNESTAHPMKTVLPHADHKLTLNGTTLSQPNLGVNVQQVSTNHQNMIETKSEVNEENGTNDTIVGLGLNAEDESDNRSVAIPSDPGVYMVNNDSLQVVCTPENKQSHVLLVDYEVGDMEHALSQLFCAFVFANRSCYTVAIDSNTTWYQTFIYPFFDLHNVKIIDTPKLQFKPLNIDSGKIQEGQSGYNFSMSDQCEDYDSLKNQEHILRSSISLQAIYIENVKDFLSKTVGNGTVTVVYVELGPEGSNENSSTILSVYTPYIRKTISHLMINHPSMTTILICSDRLNMSDCREQFAEDNWFIFPLKVIGEELALISLSDYAVLVTGRAGWQAAMFSDEKSVVYNSTLLNSSLTILYSPN